jgi:PAS domain S-box-containing protein
MGWILHIASLLTRSASNDEGKQRRLLRTDGRFPVVVGEKAHPLLPLGRPAAAKELNRPLDRLDEPPTEALLRRKVIRGCAAALLLAGLPAFLYWHSMRQQVEDADWVAHAQVVLGTLAATALDLTNEQAGAHGFALSGHKAFLEQYETGKDAAGQDLAALRRLTADNPHQQQRLDVLGPQVRVEIEASDRLIAGRRQTAAIPTAIQLVAAQLLMDAARTTLREMEDEERRLLVERARKTLAARRLTISIMAIGSLLAMVLTVMAGFTIARQIGVDARTRAQVDALNASLEQRVDQRTAALQSEISGRKQAEEARERLAAVVDSSDDAIISKNLDGMITAWNSGAEKLFGYTSFQAVGMPMRLILPPGSAQREAEILSGIGRGEGAYHFDAVRIRNDGRNIDVSMTISPIKDSGGAIVGVSNIARDISGRKQAEAALAAQAKELARFDLALQSQTVLLQCVLDSIGEGLVAADEHGQLFLWNPAAERIIGLGMAKLPSEQWMEHCGFYMPGTLAPFPVEQIPLARAIQGEANTTAEILVRNPGRPEGALIETNAQPLRDKNGMLRGGVIAIRDITQKRKAEQSIRKLNEELEQRVVERTAELGEVNKELEAFTYSVAHDLRAPLRHIAGFSGILLEEFGPSMDARAQHYLERINEGAGKMGQLVDELLCLAQVGRQETNMQAVNLNASVEEVIGVLEPDIRGRQVEWKIAELPFVECDPTLVKLVFQNLISNALKYSRPRPLAVIEIGQTHEGAFFVRDNGVGFNMKYADKLFGVFQRLHRADEFEGIGVGLATVQRIIKKHQGRVWAEAKLDQGATFYFTLGGPQPADRMQT